MPRSQHQNHQIQYPVSTPSSVVCRLCECHVQYADGIGGNPGPIGFRTVFFTVSGSVKSPHACVDSGESGATGSTMHTLKHCNVTSSKERNFLEAEIENIG